MRIAKNTAPDLIAYALSVSGGALGAERDPSGGPVVYRDLHDDGLVFRGRTREAALYYGFAAHEYAVRTGTYPPAWVDEALLALLEDSSDRALKAGDAGLDHAATLVPARPALRLAS